MSNHRSPTGFTLIELLVVVAIIAILAAIAVPNFLEAQVRAKVSRARADMRSLLTAVETYHIDSNKYPLHMLVDQVGNIQVDPWLADRGGPSYAEFHFSESNSLTTPVAYIATVPLDPFFKQGTTVNPPPNSGPQATGTRPARKRYLYANTTYRSASQAVVDNSRKAYGEFTIWSGGPDGYRRDIYLRQPPTDAMRIYDATNGTVSVGDIWRTHKSSDGSRPTVPGAVE